MKNKIAIVAVMLGCQVITVSAAFAYGGDGKAIDVLLQAPLQKIAQADMSTGGSPYATPGGGDAKQEAQEAPFKQKTQPYARRF